MKRNVELDEKCNCGAKKIINNEGIYCCSKCANVTLTDIARTQLNWNRDLPVDREQGLLFCVWWDLSQQWLAPGDQIENCYYFANLMKIPFEKFILKKWHYLFKQKES